MRKALQIGFLLLLAIGTVSAADVIERIVATVNGQAVLQSDWEEVVRYEAFVNQRPLTSIQPQERRAALDRLIDQELLRQQLKEPDFDASAPEEVEKKVDEVRKLYSGADQPDVWKSDLAHYGLTEADLQRHIGLQLKLDRLIEVRLRPNVHVNASSIEAYYREKLLPQLRQQGVKDVPLVEVSPKIEEVLAQQRINELLASWLHDLRAQSDIRLEGSPPAVTAR